MTKFYIWSDLHTELSTISHVKKMCKMYFKKDMNAYLLLAGDIGKPNDNRYLYLLQWCTRRYNKIFIICGNHEFYENDKNNALNEMCTMCKKFDNVFFLNQNVYTTETSIIFGCTLWTKLNPDEINYIHQVYNDFNFIKDVNIDNWHDSDLQWLTQMLDYYKDDTRAKIVITHHVPSYKLIDNKYKTSLCNSAFSNNDCDDLIPLVDYWIYGHTHSSRIQIINGCKFICNPVGYKDENVYISSTYFKS